MSGGKALLFDLGISYEVTFLPWESIRQNSCVLWLFLPKIELIFKTAALTESYSNTWHAVPSFFLQFYSFVLCCYFVCVISHMWQPGDNAGDQDQTQVVRCISCIPSSVMKYCGEKQIRKEQVYLRFWFQKGYSAPQNRRHSSRSPAVRLAWQIRNRGSHFMGT